MCVYLILGDDSTPEFIVISKELGCPDSILVDHHSDLAEDIIQTGHWLFLGGGGRESITITRLSAVWPARLHHTLSNAALYHGLLCTVHIVLYTYTLTATDASETISIILLLSYKVMSLPGA